MSNNQTLGRGAGNGDDAAILGGLAAVTAGVILWVISYYIFKMFSIDINFYIGLIIKGGAAVKLMPAWFQYFLLAYTTILIAIFSVIGIFYKPGVKAETHLQGIEFRDEKGLNALEKNMIKQSGKGITLGTFTFSMARETQHIMLVGGTGSGKSVTITNILKERLNRDRVIIFDPKGDFLGGLPDGFIMFGPWDKRSAAWDVSKDINGEAAALQAASMWVPEDKQNKFWSDNGRKVLAAVMIYLHNTTKGNWGFLDLSEILSKTPEEIVKIAWAGNSESRAYLSLNKEGVAEKQVLSIISTATAPLSWLHQIAATELSAKTRFSFRDFITEKSPEKTLILNYSSTYESTSQILFSVIMMLMANTITSPKMKEKKPSQPGLWMIIDEAPQLGKEAASPLRKMMEVGRSRGVRVIMATQDLNQYEAVWGKADGNVMMSLPSTKIINRASDQTAKIIEDFSGKKTVIRSSISWGEKAGSANTSLSQVEQPVIRADQIMTLQQGQGIIVLNGQPGYVKIPYAKYEHIREPLVENPDFENGLSSQARDLIKIRIADDPEEMAKIHEQAKRLINDEIQRLRKERGIKSGVAAPENNGSGNNGGGNGDAGGGIDFITGAGADDENDWNNEGGDGDNIKPMKF